MSRLFAHPVVTGVLRGGGVLVVLLIGIDVAHAAGWYPTDIGDYRITALLTAAVVGVGRRFPYAMVISVSVAVAAPAWEFAVVQVRLLPLVVAVYLAASAGARLAVVLPLVTIAALSGAFPFWPWAPKPVLLSLVLGHHPSIAVLSLGLVVAGMLLGRASSRQRRTAADLRHRNEELTRLREVDKERIAAEERTAIARDVHDTVAHHIAAIVIRAQTAARISDTRPEDLHEAVMWIADTGQNALTEMRQVVRVLRGPHRDDGRLTLTPLGERLDELVGRVRTVGVNVTLTAEEIPALTPLQDLAVLRVCQEALTNVLIHARADRADVTIHSEAAEDAVVLTVDDNGRTPSRRLVRTTNAGALGSGGSGLRGMRERADSVHGHLRAGPTDQGWRVELRVPRVPSNDPAAHTDTRVSNDQDHRAPSETSAREQLPT